MEAPPRSTRVGAYVLCVRDGDVLLVRFRDSDRWTLPGGGLDHGEAPAAGAVREVGEETGLSVALGPVLGVDSELWRRGEMHAVHIVYRGEVTGGELRDEPDGSTDHAAWVPLIDARALPSSAVLRLALTLV